MCAQLCNLGPTRISSLNQHIFTKLLLEARHHQLAGPSHLLSVPPLCICASVRSLPHFKLLSLPSRAVVSELIPCLLAGPSNQPPPTAREILLTCKADDIRLLFKSLQRLPIAVRLEFKLLSFALKTFCNLTAACLFSRTSHLSPE